MSQPEKTSQGKIWRLAWPIMLSNVTVPLLGAVDTAVVGHLPEPYYIGAVALGATVFSFVFWSFGFLRMSTGGLTAQALGADDQTEIRVVLQRALFLAVVIGVLLIAATPLIEALALKLFPASAEVEAGTATYLNIRILSAPAALADYALIGWLLGMQATRAILVVQIATNLLNIVLDLVFVIGFGWGVEGVAAATVIAQYVGVIVAFIILRRYLQSSLFTGLSAAVRAVGKWRQLLFVNFDILVRSTCLSVAFAWFNAHSAAQGDLLLAANAVLMHLLHIAAYALDGYAHVAEALVGAAVGARDRSRFWQDIRACTAAALVVALVICVFFWAFGPFILWFFSNQPAVLELAETFLIWHIFLPFISVWSFQLDGIFIGATATRAMRNAMIISLACFVPALYGLTALWGGHGLWAALAVLMVARAASLAAYLPALERSIEGQGKPPA